jgi:hypothetical protein
MAQITVIPANAGIAGLIDETSQSSLHRSRIKPGTTNGAQYA